MKECCREYLLNQFGDEDVSNEIYYEYANSVTEKIGEAKAALSSGQWQLLDRVAHTIKGNALAAGDVEMSEPAIALRRAAALNDTDGSTALIAKIEELSKLL